MIGGGDSALLVVAAAGAEVFHMPRSVICGLVEAGVISACRLVIDVGGRDRGRGAEMADDEPRHRRELVRRPSALLRIAGVVAEFQPDFWPRTPPAALMSATACSAPFLSCAPKVALAAGHRAGDADVDSCACAVPAKGDARTPSAKTQALFMSVLLDGSVASMPGRKRKIWYCAGVISAPDFRRQPSGPARS